MNCDEIRNDEKIKPRPPHALPANFARNIRYIRGFLTFLLLIWEGVNYYLSTITEGDEFGVISYATHMFGAVSGLVIGYIFLRARHTRKAERVLKCLLFAGVYGFFIIYTIVKATPGEHQDSPCNWLEYESQCQDMCYRHCMINNTCNVGFQCSTFKAC